LFAAHLFVNNLIYQDGKIKQLGIWMDHSSAFLMDATNDSIVQSTIVSELLTMIRNWFDEG